MKKILSVVLVLVLMMSVAVVAFATDGALETPGTETVFPETPSMPSIDGIFNAISDFLKLEAFAPYVEGFHEALGDFYIQLDLWLRALGVVLNNAIGGLLNSGIFG